MFKLNARVLSLAAVVLLQSATPAWGSDECEEGGPKRSCPAGSYAFRLMDQVKNGEECEEKSSCVPLAAGIGPAPSFITCEPGKGGVVSCEAWPQGDMTYDWVLGDGLVPLRGSAKPGAVQSMRCAAGKGSTLMSVTVTAPNGLSETVFSQLRCSDRNSAGGKILARR
jgi:hypothetical protein